MIKDVYIFDIDGVLVDSSHRFRSLPDCEKLDLPYWLENQTEEKINQDKLLPLAGLYKHLLKIPSAYVIMATARQCIEADFNYISERLGDANHFIYRQLGDSQSGVTLKLNPLKRLLNLKQFKNATVTMFEDNIDYLNGVCDGLNRETNKVYIPSNQGF